MLSHRLLAAAILIPATAGLMWLDARGAEAAPFLFLIVSLAGVGCTLELLRFSRPRPDPNAEGAAVPAGPRPRRTAATAGVLAVFVVTFVPHWVPHPEPTARAIRHLGAVAAGFSVALLGLLVHRVFRYRPAAAGDAPGGHRAALAAEVFAVAYVGVLLAVTAGLRWLPRPELGYLAVGSLLFGCKGGDTGAYFTGRALGRRKLIPAVSPGKTWAGAGGALLWSAAAATLWLWLARPLFAEGLAWSPLRAAVLGAACGLAGLFGDLVESVLKRDAGVKDSGSLLPGMGGLLDVCDSLLLAGPVAFTLWALWPPVM